MAPTPTNRSVDRSLRASCSIQAAHRQMRWQSQAACSSVAPLSTRRRNHRITFIPRRISQGNPKAGTQALALDSRWRGNERSLLLTPFVPAKAGTQSHNFGAGGSGFPLSRERTESAIQAAHSSAPSPQADASGGGDEVARV